MKLKLTNRKWFSVVCTLIDNDIRRHSGQNVVDSRGAAECFHNKHLMTGPKGNSEFCFPETLNVPRGEAEGNIEVEGKINSLFPEGPVIKCFVIPPNSK